MESFIYNAPTKVFFGPEVENRVGELIREYGYKKVMVHYGRSAIKKIGLYDLIIKSLKENNIDYVDFGGVEANPKLSLIEKGIELAKKEKIDFILAVGGGSVIDSAKAIADGYYVDFTPWKFSIGEEKPTTALPVGVILTISAAGSEMSNSCVITNDYTNDKRGFTSEVNRPKFALLNPKLTYSVNKFQTACGIVDIMMHTLERVIASPEVYNPLTDYLAYGLIKAVLEAGKRVIKDPNDYDARGTLMWASSLTHNGLTGCGRSYVMSVHQMEHAVSGLFDEVAHGAGLAILWPSWAKLASQKEPNRFAELAYQSFGLSRDVEINDAAKYAIAAMENYFKEIEIPTKLSYFKITESDLPRIADLYTFHGKRVLKDLIDVDYETCLTILKMSLD